MFPVFPPTDDDPNGVHKDRARRMNLGALAAGAGAALVLALVLFMRGGTSMMSTTVIPMIFGLIVVITVFTFVFRVSQSQIQEREKRKRGLDDVDMYTLIDRLVDDLDADEAAYLRRRLDERERQPDQNLAEDVADTLERRASERRAGRR